MAADAQSFARLHCHVDTPCGRIVSIGTYLRRLPDGKVALTYVLNGKVDLLQIPPPGPPRRADRLWEHTCFEAFVMPKGRPEYYELNFSPSGKWAAYAFRGYRDGVVLETEGLAPAIACTAAADHFELNAAIQLDRLPKLQRNAVARVGLSAVIEERDGKLSYWALNHPSGRPDFHHMDGFVLEV